MLEEMSWDQFKEWKSYSLTSPFGEERADLRAGIIASVIANVNRSKGAQAYKPQDFMPLFGRPRESRRPADEKTWAGMKSMARSLARANAEAAARVAKRNEIARERIKARAAAAAAKRRRPKG